MCHPRFQTRGTTMANQRQALYTSRDLIDFADRMMDSSAFHTWKGSKENMGLYSQFDFACQRPPKIYQYLFHFYDILGLSVFFPQILCLPKKPISDSFQHLPAQFDFAFQRPPKFANIFFIFTTSQDLAFFSQILCLPKKPISDSFQHLPAR